MKHNIITKIVFLIIGSLCLLSGAFAYNSNNAITYFSFDNSDLTDDGSGGISYTAYNSPTYTSGILGNAIDFDGATEYIQANSLSALPSSPFSLVYWFNADDNNPASGQAMMSVYDGSGAGFDSMRSQIDTNGYLWTYYRNSANTATWTDNVDIADNGWHMVSYTWDGSNLRTYVDGSLEDTTAFTGSWSWDYKHTVGAYNDHNDASPINHFDGKIDEYSVWNETLSGTDITTLWNSGAGLNPFDTATTPTINHNVQDFYNSENISIALNTSSNTNMSYILDSGSELSICSDCNLTNLNLTSLNESTHNIIFISTDINGQVNSSTNFTIDLTDPTINISNSTELNSYDVTWSNIFNYSDTNLDSCYLIVENTSQNCSSYTFSENGNQSIQIYVNDSAGNSANQNFTLFVNPYQYFYFEEPSSSPISNFTFGGNSYENYAAIKTYDLGLGSQNLSFVKYGYATTSVIFNLNSTSEINLTTEVQIATLYIEIYDVDTLSLITQQVDINLIGTDFAGSFSTSNGTITINNITDLPDTYELDLSSSNYEDLTYYFQHTGYAAVNLELYMQNTSDTIPIKYIILDSFGDPYSDSTCLVELQIYQISSNSYESFVMDYTNSIAEVIFNLDTTEKYKPLVTCGSSTQVYDGGKITSTPVYLTFAGSTLELFPDVPSISSNMTFVDVSNSTGRFKFTYNDLNNIISEACLEVTEQSYGTDTVLNTTCVSTSSGSINVDFAKTEGLTYKAVGSVTYEGETFPVEVYYKKIPVADFEFGILGVIFGLVIIGMLAIGGFFMGKAKGVLVGVTAGMWIMSFAVFGVWYMPVSTPLIIWSVLLIVGLIFT